MSMTEAEKRLKRCCFTGHRPGKLKQSEASIKQSLATAIAQAIARGYVTFITGMAQGTDIWAAKIVLEHCSANPRLRLICALPHPNFEKSWIIERQERFNAVLISADLHRTIWPVYSI